METPYILLGFSVLLSLIGYIWNQNKTTSDKLQEKVVEHGVRIQRVEDVQGTKIDNLSKELKEFQVEMKHELGALKDMVHKDKNMEQQLNTTLGLLLKELQKSK